MINYQLETIKYFNKEDELRIIIENNNIKKIRQLKFSGSQLILYFKNLRNIELKKNEINEKIIIFKKYCLDNSGLENWNDFLDKYDKEVIDRYLQDFVVNIN